MTELLVIAGVAFLLWRIEKIKSDIRTISHTLSLRGICPMRRARPSKRFIDTLGRFQSKTVELNLPKVEATKIN